MTCCFTKHMDKETEVELAKRFANLVDDEKKLIEEHLNILIRLSIKENGVGKK